jgi:hypothetical protein
MKPKQNRLNVTERLRLIVEHPRAKSVFSLAPMAFAFPCCKSFSGVSKRLRRHTQNAACVQRQMALMAKAIL